MAFILIELKSEPQRVVFIAQRLDDFESDTEFYGHCEVGEEEAKTMIQGPGWDTAEEAVAWGRAQAPTVIIRIGRHPWQQHYSAGTVFPQSWGPPVGGMLTWPPVADVGP